MKFEVIYKFALIVWLLLALLGVLLSGAGIFLGLNLENLWQIHGVSALLLLLAIGLHVFNRRKKLVKTTTQFADLVRENRYPSYCNLDRLIMTFEPFSVAQIAEQLQLNLPQFLAELGKGKIDLDFPQKSLRENFPNNDEKIFAAVTIALKLRFSPELHLNLGCKY